MVYHCTHYRHISQKLITRLMQLAFFWTPCFNEIVFSSFPLEQSLNLKHFCHITPLLKSLHWLKMQQRRPIDYKVLSITYNSSVWTITFLSPQPSQCSIQPYNSLVWHHHSATSNSVRSRFKVTDDRSLPIMLLYFRILYPKNVGSSRRLNHSIK